MFGFLTALVEKGLFTKISVNFLIVGHTHASIDQYFSVLSTAIKNAHWIGTPLALHHVLANAHSLLLRPRIVKEITVYHDWVTPIDKIFNKTIKVRN